MEETYQKKLEALLTESRPRLADTYELEFKNVFGAVGGYVNGKIFISCGKFGVALRLPTETLESVFKEKDVRHLKYFPKGHIKKEYAVLTKRILENKKKFKKLVDKSIEYVGAL